MSANFSSDSIVWVDGQVTLPKHILKILGIENGHRSNVTFIVENGEVKIVNSAASVSYTHLTLPTICSV